MAAVAILRNVLLMILTRGDLQRVILATINDKSLARVQLQTRIRMRLDSSVREQQERPQNTCGAAELRPTDGFSGVQAAIFPEGRTARESSAVGVQLWQHIVLTARHTDGLSSSVRHR